MRDDRLREILSAGPGAEQTEWRSARARKRAITEYKASPPRTIWRPVLAAGLALLLGGIWFVERPAAPGLPGSATEKRRIEMQLQLSDGTRVNWVMDDRYAL